MSRRFIQTNPYRRFLEPGDASAWTNITPDGGARSFTIEERKADDPVEIYINEREKKTIPNRNRVGF